MTGPGDEKAAVAGGQSHCSLRASHADREQVIEVLKAAFVQGRLARDELDARAGQAFAARTYADLAALTADIPVGPAAARLVPRPARAQARPPMSNPAKAGICAAIAIAVATVLTFATGGLRSLLIVPFYFMALLAGGAPDTCLAVREALPRAATASTGAGRPGPRGPAARPGRPRSGSAWSPS